MRRLLFSVQQGKRALGVVLAQKKCKKKGVSVRVEPKEGSKGICVKGSTGGIESERDVLERGEG